MNISIINTQVNNPGEVSFSFLVESPSDLEIFKKELGFYESMLEVNSSLNELGELLRNDSSLSLKELSLKKEIIYERIINYLSEVSHSSSQKETDLLIDQITKMSRDFSGSDANQEIDELDIARNLSKKILSYSRHKKEKMERLINDLKNGKKLIGKIVVASSLDLSEPFEGIELNIGFAGVKNEYEYEDLTKEILLSKKCIVSGVLGGHQKLNSIFESLREVNKSISRNPEKLSVGGFLTESALFNSLMENVSDTFLMKAASNSKGVIGTIVKAYSHYLNLKTEIIKKKSKIENLLEVDYVSVLDNEKMKVEDFLKIDVLKLKRDRSHQEAERLKREMFIDQIFELSPDYARRILIHPISKKWDMSPDEINELSLRVSETNLSFKKGNIGAIHFVGKSNIFKINDSVKREFALRNGKNTEKDASFHYYKLKGSSDEIYVYFGIKGATYVFP